MARRYDIKTATGETVIPVADDSFYTDAMSVSSDVSDIYISFYSDAEGTIPVTPTGGTVMAWGEYSSGFFLEAQGGFVYAVNVSPPDTSYTPQIIDGCSIRARIDVLGVTGALSMKAFAFKRG